MPRKPYRSGKTWLNDDQLILLDSLFEWNTSQHSLRREDFSERFNLGYSHSLDDKELRITIDWLCERGLVTARQSRDEVMISMTPAGGELWSLERCPAWDRYCTEQYRTTLSGRRMMSVLAVSANVRDEFFAYWPPTSARRRTSVIKNHWLIEWHPFDVIYVGTALYDEDPDCQVQAFIDNYNRMESKRSWWRTIRELQKFL